MQISLPFFYEWFFTEEYTVFFSAAGQGRTSECPRYDVKQSDGKAPVILELLRMRSTSSLPSLQGPLCLGAVAIDRVLSMGQIELFWLFNSAKNDSLEKELFDHLTMCKFNFV